MAKSTAIALWDATWNPWMGCSKVSPGCLNCYAERVMSRSGKNFNTVTRSRSTFYAPLKWKEPKRIFTCSWSDFFHKQADPWREEAWKIMLEANWHTYMILTKRPGLAVSWARQYHWPDHIWIGTSIESAKYLPRLAVLNRVPAKVRFVSVEPLLKPLLVDFNSSRYFYGISWVIIGGESGPNHRVMPLSAMEGIITFCQWSRLPIFVKQDSGPRPGMQGRIPDRLWALKQIPE